MDVNGARLAIGSSSGRLCIARGGPWTSGGGEARISGGGDARGGVAVAMGSEDCAGAPEARSMERADDFGNKKVKVRRVSSVRTRGPSGARLGPPRNLRVGDRTSFSSPV
eukprot:5452209-Pleurochrysis_carterae.AAC.1